MATTKSTTERGLGWSHQEQREHLMRLHVDGTLCWWCNAPMYRDPARNFDHAALNADHSKSRADGGTKADRLLHGKCNKSRGKGLRDHLRPALGPQPNATITTREWL